MTAIQVPASFSIRPFYEQSARIHLPKGDAPLSAWLESVPFAIDVAAALHEPHVRIYEAPYSEFNEVFNWWEDTWKGPIQTAFSNDEKDVAGPMMIQGTANFLSLLFWIGRQPVQALTSWQEDMLQCPITPMNLKERMPFIVSRPRHYASFIQLNQMYIELRKSLAVYRLKHS
ncbi:hypothetical protein G4V62_01720 [Bacillaceae bacterium SIJ1]|uniref:YpoC family protein n=1 Tax=Litoribacterium kuwaitense TaxID=1398745 RepID=UPI0013EDA3F9|nr:hypothetical protein [Litoribacterium kuwaitense]NGP43745.1 hypothetical protein [Litoribacterium kuwaitense]